VNAVAIAGRQQLCINPAVKALGKAVQVDPVKPTLKAPGTKGLKLFAMVNLLQSLLSVLTCAATPRFLVAHKRAVP